ncbi:MFS transporter [Rhodospirillaceae bacterium SYSU D60014]|uniref:MFS transporter n=1 Tax=Virgifigura deserti TaxID=2268457 RepID=UPI000E66E0E9
MSCVRTDWTVVAFGICLAALVAYQQFKLPPVLPTLLQLYGYDHFLAGTFMSVYAAAGLLLSLPLGGLMQRYGAAPFIYLAFTLLIGANLLTLLAPPDGGVMLATRSLEGIAYAICAICGPIFANLSASPRNLPLVAALTAAWIPIGQVTATLVAPAALAFGGWQWLWAVGLLGTVGMALWTRHLTRVGRLEPWPSGGPSGAASDRAAAALSPADRIGLILAAGIFMLWSSQYFAYMTWLPQYLVEAHGLSEVWAIAGYMLPIVILLIVNLLTGLALRAGVPLGPLLLGALLSQAALWWLAPLTTGVVAGIASLVVYGIGAGITPSCLFALPSAILGSRRAGPQAFAVVMTGRNIGVLIGPVLLAQIYEQAGSWMASVPIFGAATTIAAAAALYFCRQRRGYGTSR